MRSTKVTLTCGDEIAIASLTLEQMYELQDAKPEDKEMAWRQALCHSFNNAAADPTKWDLKSVAKRFDLWDIKELIGELAKICGLVDVGEAEASEWTASNSSLAW